MTRKMLINASDSAQCRIAVLDNDTLDELYVEKISQTNTLGNVYKGRVVNIERSIQACFIDFGGPRNGFLHISDLTQEYKKRAGKSSGREASTDGDAPKARPRGRRSDPLMQDIFRRGDEVLVQVTKDSVAHKGPTLTTYLSIPGRFLVLMPQIKRLGVSRRIASDTERKRLRELLKEMDLPTGLGFIVRTAGLERSKLDLGRDVKYLLRMWDTLLEKDKTSKAPALLYQESDLVIRTIRDHFSNEIDEIVVDSDAVLRRILDFLKILTPRIRCRALYYKGARPLFDKFKIETAVEAINRRVVPLPSGGSISIDQTEAVVAIDVNSGRSKEKTDPERTSLVANLEAAREIARQLRLRDLGGLILNDFIDMKIEKNQRAVEKELRDALKPDKARTQVLKTSKFGIIEMTRQRIRPSKRSGTHEPCPRCEGTGLVKSVNAIGLEIYRKICATVADKDVNKIRVRLATAVCTHIQSERQTELLALETDHGKVIELCPEPTFGPEQLEISQNGSVMQVTEKAEGDKENRPRRRRRRSRPSSSRKTRTETPE